MAQLVESMRYKLKVAVSIPDGVIGPSGCTMALSFQHKRTINISCGYRRLVHSFHVPIV